MKQETSETKALLRRAGFTLIELLVVIAILGVLVATFAASTASARETARITKATAECRELGNAIRLFCITQQDTLRDADGGDPISELSLRDGLQEATGAMTNLLTKPSDKNGRTVYFAANDRAIRRNILCDPWGNPYRVRLKKVNPAGDNELAKKNFEIIVPLDGRHRALESAASPSNSLE